MTGMTAIQVRVRRTIALDTFADITDVPLALPAPGQPFDRDGLMFQGDLTAEQVEAIWWRASSRDAEDEARRRAVDAAASGGATNFPLIQHAYLYGYPLPAAIYPLPPEPEPTVTTSKTGNAVTSLLGAPKTSRK